MRSGVRRWSALALVALVGLFITGGLSWAARRAYDENEDRLLHQRTAEVAAVLTATVPAIEVPLAASAAVVELGSDPGPFREVIGTQVGPQRRFASASVWEVGADAPALVIGGEPRLAEQTPEQVASFIERAAATDLMAVIGLLETTPPRIGYGFTEPGESADFVVYAEQELAANRVTTVPADSAFADLDFALYLGAEAHSGTLLSATTTEVPLRGRTAQRVTAFGDSELLVEIAPTGSLGGALLAWLAWLVAGLGLLATGAVVATTDRLQRRRRYAEELAEDNKALYIQQQLASADLQLSLLPRILPTVSGLQVTARYATGVTGTEVGGDWYDVLDIGPELTVLVVGDVSGRGLGAAAVMSAVRHWVRALAWQGDPPEAILSKINQPGTIDLAGHFVTVLCAAFDRTHGRLAVASAGHPPPLLLADTGSRFIPVPPGPPIGVARPSTRYESVVTLVEPGSTILMFTDGLFERRGETIDDGLERLRQSTSDTNTNGLEGLAEGVFTAMTTDTAQDDSALLAIRWAP